VARRSNFLHHHAGSPTGVFRPARSNITRRCPRCRCVNPARRASHSAREERHGHRRRAREEWGDDRGARSSHRAPPPRATLQPLAIELYPDFARAVGNIKARGVVARGTLTVEQPPAYSTLCIAPSLDYLERAYDDVKYGKDSTLRTSRSSVRMGAWRSMCSSCRPARRAGSRPGRADPQGSPQPGGAAAGRGEPLPRRADARPDSVHASRPGWSRYPHSDRGAVLVWLGTHPGGGIPGAAGRNAAREIL